MRSPSYLSVAQLDSASDSDSEGHGFESRQTGQTEYLNTQHGAKRNSVFYFEKIGLQREAFAL